MIPEFILKLRLLLMRFRVATLRQTAQTLQNQSTDDYFASVALDEKAHALETQYKDRARQWGFIATE
jgi:hypothetical protein